MAQGGGSTVGTIDVQPETFPAGECGKLRQGVDGAGVGSPGAGDDAKWTPACIAIFANRPLQNVQRQAILRVGRELANVRTPESEQAQRFVQGGMGLIGEVYGCPLRPVLQPHMTRGGERGE